MFSRIHVVGRGRVGAAIQARLAEQELTADRNPDLILLCVPDQAITEVARAQPIGPWIAHVSGATPLTALAPHERRFGVHPLQTFVAGRGPEQLDGAWGAVTAGTRDAASHGWWLAERLGLRPFELRDDRRALYHTGASIASNFLVAIHDAASRAVEAAGVPRDALLPLIRRTIDTGFALTGPISRGDWETVDAHVQALRRDLPDLEPLYNALAAYTRTIASR